MPIARDVLVSVLLLLSSRAAMAAEPAGDWPGEKWPTASPAELGLDETQLAKARDYALDRRRLGLRHLAAGWCWPGATSRALRPEVVHEVVRRRRCWAGDQGRQGAARRPGEEAPSRRSASRRRANAKTGWLDGSRSACWPTRRPGSTSRAGTSRCCFEPGTQWDYSDGGPNWLAECITLAYRRDLDEVMFERVFTPLGITADDLVWRKNAYRPRPARRHHAARVRLGFQRQRATAMARIGYLYLRDGWWDGRADPAARVYASASAQPDPAWRSCPCRKPEDYGQRLGALRPALVEQCRRDDRRACRATPTGRGASTTA